MSEKPILDSLREASPTISVGILTADLMCLGDQLALLEGTGVEILHFDVMDGCFCPMMTVGPPFIKGVKTKHLKDVHLMVEEPLDKVDAYVAAGADMITAHFESTRHIHRVLQYLDERENVNDPVRGIARGVALNPGTPVEVLRPLLEDLEIVCLLGINPGWGGQRLIPSTFSRIEEVKRLISESDKEILVCLDGGAKKDNIQEIASFGADIVVTGSAVFDGKAPRENARYMLSAVRGS